MNDDSSASSRDGGSAGLDRMLAALVAELGADCVLVGDAVAGRQTADWSGAPAVTPPALLLPRTPAQVAAALRVCAAFAQPLAVQGGLTGLAGGANPQPGEIALSLARLNAVEDIDDAGGTAVVQAGVTLEQLQTAARERGWFFPLDLGARGSCQLGGNAATNAGGNRVVRYGMMRDAVLGLEVALADGTLLGMLDRVVKNNAGFDLKHLFVGSEGTLGVITRLALRLVPQPSAGCTVLCAVRDFAAATRLLREARRRLAEMTAFELMWHDFFEASAEVIGAASPFAEAHPLYVLIETLGGDAEGGAAAVERFLEAALEDGTVVDAVVAASLDQAARLWAFREGIAELLPRVRPYATFDVSVAMPLMDGLVARLRALLAEHHPTRRHFFFGHLGDNNLHMVCGPLDAPGEFEALEGRVYREVGLYGGSISAEHGIGMVKKPFLHESRDAAQVALMRGLKGLLDPQGILNRGRVVGD